ncbi:PREDICTED: probable E3 ubiquitin-protein ligase ARI8 [Erythranthe guttata]|uniref:probable E3 ubiquitin-protein ligase ARI8 n=1 Tax=Erythranthe guttata TaxID=4155 RepID=UPI00064DAC7C|nr:PREDICTED: probable E3 ubiquitin-protein ligase ARI8 [Erythranthe guttata]|eukprot:XP_012837714.1 PREDICTED: probable E3 ubiquitin-protein ligase ARI8 [Erythranthe guttata]
MEYSDGDSFYKPPYTMVDENRIRQLKDKDISEVCTLLSVSRSFACPLLRRNNWSKNSVFDEWFADEKQVRRGREFDEYEEKLKRYMHYYERWAAIHKSREITAGNLKWAKDERICVVAENNQQLPGDGVELVIEAFELIMESRTALKWSYAYGYYMPWRANSAKLAFFLFLKGQAERVLETLHRCAERGVEKYSKTDFHLYEFRDFTDELRGLTDLTRNHFGELVRALENNLSEVTEVKNLSKNHQLLLRDGRAEQTLRFIFTFIPNLQNLLLIANSIYAF